MNTLLISLLQAVLVLLLAPLASGFSRQLRCKMHNRRGPGILQDYRDLKKYFARQDTMPPDSGAIFRWMPVVLVSCMFVVAMAVPMLTYDTYPYLSDLIAVVYLMALARFVFSLAALDSGSAYPGIGGIRELILGILVEPSLLLSLFVVALMCGTTQLGQIGLTIQSGDFTTWAALVTCAIALGFACYMELGKLPYDLAEAEQELQEGPLMEYSGPSLGMIKLGLAMKQVIMVSLFASLFVPWGIAAGTGLVSVLIGLVLWIVKLLVLIFLAGIFENSVMRVRFVKVSKQSWIAVGFAALAFAFYLIGI